MEPICNIVWVGDAATGFLRLLDQTLLPQQSVYVDYREVEPLVDAIRRLVVRGAPAIGVAAAYGCVLGAQAGNLAVAAEQLAASRPTAVNLFWAIRRMLRVQPATPAALLAEARVIHHEDAAMCRAIGEHGLARIRRHLQGQGGSGQSKGAGVLTHCNAGSLATGGVGTATAPLYLAHEQGLDFTVFADETRPLLQGARLTAYELMHAGVKTVLLCDNMAGAAMQQGRIQMVIVGADRIAGNGDAANKIGTYSAAVLAKHHGVPFFVAAPSSTFDMSLASGAGIPIEHRASQEITEGFGKRTAPAEVATFSPAFDVTPHELITAIITERGVIEPVDAAHVAAALGPAAPAGAGR